MTVSIPTGLAQPGSSFSFPLSKEAAGGTPIITMPDGKPVPNWLQYKPGSETIVANNVPVGGLPLKISVSVGGKIYTVVISAQQ